MYTGQIDLDSMGIKASETNIINEIMNGLHKKRAGGLTLENNTIHFSGGFCCGIVFQWHLLSGITKGNITVENNKIKYSLSFLETYIAFGILVPFVLTPAIFSEGDVPSFVFLVPIIFVILIVCDQEFLGSWKFSQFLKKCVLRAEEMRQM
jgi:hypothetical protein